LIDDCRDKYFDCVDKNNNQKFYGMMRCCTCFEWSSLMCTLKRNSACSLERCDGNCERKYGNECWFFWDRYDYY
jgi:hypothetical protein